MERRVINVCMYVCMYAILVQYRENTPLKNGTHLTNRVTLVYLYHVNRCGHHKKLSIAKLDFVQVCELSLNFYNNTLREFYKFSDSRGT